MLTADLLFYYTIRAGITPARKILSLVIHCNIIISHISPDFSTHLHAAETYDNSKSIQSTDSLQLAQHKVIVIQSNEST